jgi:hypothetical protein
LDVQTRLTPRQVEQPIAAPPLPSQFSIVIRTSSVLKIEMPRWLQLLHTADNLMDSAPAHFRV